MDLFDQVLSQGTLWGSPALAEDHSSSPSLHHMSDDPSSDSHENPIAPVSKTVFCTCAKSRCKQNYCPCFKAGSKCGSKCSCCSCKNQEFIPRRIAYILGSPDQLTLAPFSFWHDLAYPFQTLIHVASPNQSGSKAVEGWHRSSLRGSHEV